MSRSVSARSGFACLTATMFSVLAELGQRLRRDVDDAAPGDVVDDHRQAGRRGDGAEVREHAALGRLVVVGHHGQDGVHAAGLGRARELDAVTGVVGAGAGDDGRRDRPRRATTVRNIASFSSSLSVGDSPVVPATTRPSEPLARR